MVEPTTTPNANRPRGALWRTLQTEGIVWEGQTLISGDTTDLPARLIVTHQRLVFVQGGQVLLELPREWLRPAPYLGGDGSIQLGVDATGQGRPEQIRLVAKDGRRAAAHLVSLIGSAGVRATRSLPMFVPDQSQVVEPRFTMARHREQSAPRLNPISSYAILDPDDFPPLTHRPLTGRSFDQPDHTGSHPNRAFTVDQTAATSGPAMIPAPQAPISTERHRTWNLEPLPSLAPRGIRKSRSGLAFRLSGLILLLVAAAAFGSGQLPSLPGRESATHAPSSELSAPFSPGGPAAAALTPDTGANDAAFVASTAAAVATARAVGVGGEHDTVTPAPPAAQSQTPGAAAVLTQPAIRTPVPETATVRPSPSPSATPTSTPEPTATPAGAIAQQASIAEGEIPAPVFASAGVRYTVTAAARGAAYPDLGLGEIAGFDWLVVVLDAENGSKDDVALNPVNFALFASGPGGTFTYAPDPTSAAAAQALGLPGLDAAGAMTIAPGASGRFALAFAIGASNNYTELLTGNEGIDMSDALGRPVDLTRLDPPPSAPELVEARVVAVIDGRTIEVEVDGVRNKVRYLGIDVPGNTACFGPEATTANETLVGGQRVWLERERRNGSAKSVLLRDVWVTGADGNLVLAAQQLVAQGAAVAASSSPDVRYAGWIRATAGTAQYYGRGLWGACGGLAQSASAPLAPLTVADRPPAIV